MSRSYIVEIDEVVTGIIAPDGRGFRFHHADSSFMALEGQVFPDYWHAERAARAVLDTLKIRRSRARKVPDRGYAAAP